MASITERKRASGTIYLAQITRRQHGYTESRSFPTRKAAETWAKRRERELDNLIKSGEQLTKSTKSAAPTLSDAIDKYLDQNQNISRSKQLTLLRIKNEYTISTKNCDRIFARDIIDLANQISNRPKCSPSTVLSYLAHLSTVFEHAPVLWGYQLDKSEFDKARTALKHVGTIQRTNVRERLPTIDELNNLMQHFNEHDKKDFRCLPMCDLFLFALLSARRVSEITSIKWADYEPDQKRVKVRGMKSPTKKGGIDLWCNLTDEAIAIINKQPRTDERIFPYNHMSISRRFVNACKLLEIDDLHWHDTRHFAATRFAEMGMTVPQIASYTGHKTWSMVNRYAHVAKTGDRLAGWKWLDKICGQNNKT